MVEEENMIDACDLVEENYVTYGSYVNTTRATTGPDGLKPVQRRLLLSVHEEARNKLTRSNVVVGAAMKRHPHGESYDTLTKMVRNGFIKGKGDFGSRDMFEEESAAAMRYTSVQSRKEFSENIFNLVKHVPHVNVPGESLLEPKYLPVPIPLCLTTGTSGVGVGLLNNVPAFSPTSLYKAMLKDNPKYLRPPDGVLIIDDSDLQKIWDTGEGSLVYGLKVYEDKSTEIDGKTVAVVEGSTKVFTPNINKTFKKDIEQGLVYVRDESTDISRVVISRVKNIRKISDDYVLDKVKQAATTVKFFRMYISDGGKAVRVSLKDWLKLNWNLYQKAVKDWKSNTIKDLKEKVKVFGLIPKIGPKIMAGESSAKIAENMGLELKLVKMVESKPMRLLRKNDFNVEINKLQREIQKVSRYSPKRFANKFVKSLEQWQCEI